MSLTSTSKAMMKYQYQLNEQAAATNRNWQERLANSAHQREIADLKAAGLNPVLSVTGGSGATTPSGATASVSDGAGYASALANLEAARINSATQIAMHTTPGANSFIGQLEWVSDKLGLPLSALLGFAGDSIGFDGSPSSFWQKVNDSDLLTLGTKADLNSGKLLGSFFKNKDLRFQDKVFSLFDKKRNAKSPAVKRYYEERLIKLSKSNPKAFAVAQNRYVQRKASNNRNAKTNFSRTFDAKYNPWNLSDFNDLFKIKYK